MTNKPPIEIRLSSMFVRAVKRLRKHYRSVDHDLKTLIERLQAGENPGDRVQGLESNIVYKVRIRNTDAKRGKRGGYRVIYYVQRKDLRVLVYIYAKSAQEDISNDELRALIDEVSSDQEE